VQVAAGMHHAVDRGRPEPARRVLGKGRRRLEALGPVCLGLDLEGLLGSVRRWEEWLAGGAEGEAPDAPRLDVLDPEAVV
jgi:hypothetical protein